MPDQVLNKLESDEQRYRARSRGDVHGTRRSQPRDNWPWGNPHRRGALYNAFPYREFTSCLAQVLNVLVSICAQFAYKRMTNSQMPVPSGGCTSDSEIEIPDAIGIVIPPKIPVRVSRYSPPCAMVRTWSSGSFSSSSSESDVDSE